MTSKTLPLPAYFSNGQLHRQSNALVDFHDRGLAYGDGVFETMLACDGHIPFWQYHYQRLLKGLKHLGITLDVDSFKTYSQTAFKYLKDIPQTCVVKLIVTRGESARGYMPGDAQANVFISISLLSQNRVSQTGCSVHLCKEILPVPVSWAGLKTLNQLSYVLASQERKGTAFDEGVVCTQSGHVIEATARNIFCVKDNCLLTPDLTNVGVAGVMRDMILEKFAPQLDIRVKVCALTMPELLAADEIFLCNSVTGIWPVVTLSDAVNNLEQHWPVGTMTLKLQALFESAIKSQPN